MKFKLGLTALFAALLMPIFIPTQGMQAQDEPRRIEIIAKRFDFTPGEITLKKGEHVVLVLRCLDAAHGIRLKELGIDLKAKKGQSSEQEFTPDKAGTFDGRCSVFCGSGHGDMTLVLHVVE